MIAINYFIKEAHENSVENGFYDSGSRNVGELLMLIVSELAEALEADRKSRFSQKKFILTSGESVDCTSLDEIDFKSLVKDTFEDEIADTFIRLFDLCGYLDIDIEKHIIAKMKYNRFREHKHGKKY